ncbi:hypothetical protein QBC36DRAFT_291746 [Triangularia setosa]|uniref:Uncharacterized protein n=1 Tax=Triangularia setosa TaxID=2587417 RepID=A0AAN6W4M2_9PEZI|nr:hypothetical protein QBC36DRAFT_291746 [Podospora setosa]
MFDAALYSTSMQEIGRGGDDGDLTDCAMRAGMEHAAEAAAENSGLGKGTLKYYGAWTFKLPCPEEEEKGHR